MKSLSPRLGKLTPKQLEKLSDIIADIGQVFLASMVIPFFAGVDTLGISVLVFGGIAAGICWILSIRLAKGKEYDNHT